MWAMLDAIGPNLPFVGLDDDAVQIPRTGHWQRSAEFIYAKCLLCWGLVSLRHSGSFVELSAEIRRGHAYDANQTFREAARH